MISCRQGVSSATIPSAGSLRSIRRRRKTPTRHTPRQRGAAATTPRSSLLRFGLPGGHGLTLLEKPLDGFPVIVQVRLENLVHVGRDRHVATTDDTGDLADTLVIRRTYLHVLVTGERQPQQADVTGQVLGLGVGQSPRRPPPKGRRGR